MAFVLVGSGGTAISGTSSTTLALTTTADLSLANSRFCVLTVSSDNISTSDGATTNHSSVTGGTGTWTKIGEYTNSNAAAAAGVTTSLWLFLPSGANATGTVFTITFSGAVVDKAAQIRRFTWDTAKGVRAAATPVGFGVDASNGFGSGALSGLPSKEYLFVAGLGKEANTTTALTPSSGWGTWSVARSRNNAAAVASWGEHLISTATGATSSPTLAVSGDTASVVAALEEYSLVTSHDTTGALAGPGSTLSGTAARTRVHAATGALTGQGSSIAGTATLRRLHTTSGALTGQGSAVAGSAARFRAHGATGALQGQGATVAGVASRTRVHGSSGSLAGSGAVIAGSASRSLGPVTHGTSGALVGQGSTLAGTAARSVVVSHETTGALVGQGAVIEAMARHGLLPKGSRGFKPFMSGFMR